MNDISQEIPMTLFDNNARKFKTETLYDSN